MMWIVFASSHDRAQQHYSGQLVMSVKPEQILFLDAHGRVALSKID